MDYAGIFMAKGFAAKVSTKRFTNICNYINDFELFIARNDSEKSCCIGGS
jgi:hypothetical protein